MCALCFNCSPFANFVLKILGGTIVAALNLIKERGVDNKQIKVVNNLEESFLVSVEFTFTKFLGIHVRC